MRIVQDNSPRFKVQGIKSLKGTSFSTEDEARKYGFVHMLMEVLWRAREGGKIDYKVPNPAFACALAIVEALEHTKSKPAKELRALIVRED